MKSDKSDIYIADTETTRSGKTNEMHDGSGSRLLPRYRACNPFHHMKMTRRQEWGRDCVDGPGERARGGQATRMMTREKGRSG